MAATTEEEARERKHEHHGFGRRQYMKREILQDRELELVIEIEIEAHSTRPPRGSQRPRFTPLMVTSTLFFL